MEIRQLLPQDEAFPKSLKDIPQPPKQIYVHGDLKALQTRTLLAIVGSRRVSYYGEQVTKKLAAQATRRGATIVSGLALGVDSIAHRAALDAGGITVAVLGSGLDKITPSSNEPLAQRILDNGGLLLSEYPPGHRPHPFNFVERNRLVAGLSKAILITEAAEKSGAIHTADFANDQSKQVMVVPGNITSELSRGTNKLARDGAAIVLDIRDICLELGLKTDKVFQTQGSTPNETAILQLLQAGCSSGNELLERTGLDVARFNQTLSLLEIRGQIYTLGGNQWALREV